MLGYDSFRGHLEKSVKKKFHDSNVDLAVIPGGLTSVCQPLDVGINKPFKDNLRKEWHLGMADGGAGETIAGNLKRAKYSDVCNWVKRSWDNISNEIIINSFVNCGITDSLDDLNNEDEELEISDIDDCDDGIHDNDNSCDDNSCDDNSCDDEFYDKSDEG